MFESEADAPPLELDREPDAARMQARDAIWLQTLGRHLHALYEPSPHLPSSLESLVKALSKKLGG
jgi:hypothetical protein